MAHVLIGWELGAARGHIERMLRFHDALVAHGHRVDLALQRIDAVAAEDRAIPGFVWQSPLWPRLLASTARSYMKSPTTLGDILARLGLSEPRVLSTLITGWEAILATSKPDVVVAEYAPALLLATRGRVPAIALGGGFDTPPAHMPVFPSFTAQPPANDEAVLLARANDDLAAIGRPPLSALPAMFACERALVIGIAEMDPYLQWRTEPMIPPLLGAPLGPLEPPQGEELFVYWQENAPTSTALWQGLARSGLPVRVHIPRLIPAHAAELTRMGFTVEPKPLPFAQIARRSRLLLSHGGNGFVTHGLLHGRPQVAVHFDLEKRNNGMALDRLKLGAQMPLGDFDPDAFGRGLRLLHGDQPLADHAMATAAVYRERLKKPALEIAVEAVAALE